MEEQIFLHVGGPVPGIPGDHGPGAYLVDYTERTIRPVPVVASPVPGINVAQSEPSEPQPVEPLPLAEIVAEVAQLEQQVQALEQPQ